MSEAQILHDIRLALGREPDLVLWRLGQGVTVDSATGRQYRAGLVPGAADLIGILSEPGSRGLVGRWIALEVKAPRGRLSPEQARWLALVRSRGGFAAVVRSVEDAWAALARARAGACE